MQFKQITLSIIAASALIFGPAAFEATTSIDLGTTAHAKNGGGGGNGNGGGRSNGNSGGNGKSNKSSSFSGSTAKGGYAYGKDKAESLGNSRGDIASKLGALNAAHASANARLHASPNSRVGLIAAYEEQVQLAVNYQQTDDDLAQLQELEFEDPENTTDIETLRELAERYDIDFNEEDPEVTREAIASAINDSRAVYEENAGKQAYQEVYLLSLAANKPLSTDVIGEVNSLLALEYENADITQELIDSVESGEVTADSQ